MNFLEDKSTKFSQELNVQNNKDRYGILEKIFPTRKTRKSDTSMIKIKENFDFHQFQKYSTYFFSFVVNSLFSQENSTIRFSNMHDEMRENGLGVVRNFEIKKFIDKEIWKDLGRTGKSVLPPLWRWKLFAECNARGWRGVWIWWYVRGSERKRDEIINKNLNIAYLILLKRVMKRWVF